MLDNGMGPGGQERTMPTGAGDYFAAREAASPEYKSALVDAREAETMASSISRATGQNRYIVTVKLKRNPAHNPQNKVIGPCPLSSNTCTDVTGEHHSELCFGDNPDDVRRNYVEAGFHVTRIEQI
jgi:hypothetical protein